MNSQSVFPMSARIPPSAPLFQPTVMYEGMGKSETAGRYSSVLPVTTVPMTSANAFGGMNIYDFVYTEPLPIFNLTSKYPH